MCINQQILHLAEVLAIPVDYRAVANVLSRIGNREFGIAQPHQLGGRLNLSHDVLLLSRNKRARGAETRDLFGHDHVSLLLWGRAPIKLGALCPRSGRERELEPSCWLQRDSSCNILASIDGTRRGMA